MDLRTRLTGHRTQLVHDCRITTCSGAAAGAASDGTVSEGAGAGVANPADEVIVEAMVQLAHRLGLTVTAECVETSDQATRLRRIGCDTGQGWLYSRPVAPDRISALLDSAGSGRAAGQAGVGNP
ncbi:hypothetical protein STENM223S_00403 [Streptomyces tendae]